MSLIWELIKNNNAFLVKRNGVCFSTEKQNLTNVHSYKFSGLANKRAVGVELVQTKKGKKVALTVRRPTKANSPRKSIASNVVGVQRATKATNGLAKGYYRPDLKSYARARIAALKKAVKPKGKKKVSKKSA